MPTICAVAAIAWGFAIWAGLDASARFTVCIGGFPFAHYAVPGTVRRRPWRTYPDAFVCCVIRIRGAVLARFAFLAVGCCLASRARLHTPIHVFVEKWGGALTRFWYAVFPPSAVLRRVAPDCLGPIRITTVIIDEAPIRPCTWSVLMRVRRLRRPSLAGLSALCSGLAASVARVFLPCHRFIAAFRFTEFPSRVAVVCVTPNSLLAIWVAAVVTHKPSTRLVARGVEMLVG